MKPSWWVMVAGCAVQVGPGPGEQGGFDGGEVTGTPNAVPQAEPWVQFDRTATVICGVTAAGALDCPHAASFGVELPEGAFTAVELAGGGLAGCALEASGEVVCFDGTAGSALVTDAPAGRFTALAGHSLIAPHVCAVDEGGAVFCWGDDATYPPPDERFLPVLSAWSNTWCGITEGGGISCWRSHDGDLGEVTDHVPEGVWDAVTVGDGYACARRGTTVECWGDVPGDAPPDEALAVVEAGESNTCGIRPDGSAGCWGTDGWGQLGVPDGAFVSVQPAREQVCGLRPDGELTCWGWALEW